MSKKLTRSTSPESTNTSRQKKAFGEALDRVLSAHQVSQSALASGLGVSPSLINHTMHGKRYASGEYVDKITTTLGLSDQEAVELHTAAAIDAGFKLDLTKPERKK